MKIAEFLNRRCLTCNKELNTPEEFKQCFHDNHDIGIKGQFEIGQVGFVDQMAERTMGKALNDAKAGDIVSFELD